MAKKKREAKKRLPHDVQRTSHDRSAADSRRPPTAHRIAYLDCFSGISGDMFLGALIDAGVPAELFQRSVEALNVGARLEITRVDRSGICATKVDVLVNGKAENPREHNPHPFHHETEHVREHSHPHAHSHERQHDSHVAHSSPGSQAAHSHGRHLSEIRQIISKKQH